jgi:hypothetical protein
MLVTALKKTAAEADMTFAAWMTGFGLTGGVDSSDADGDGIPAGIEFALGLNPTLSDADQVTTSLVSNGTQLQLAYPKRLNSSTRFTLQATTSSNPSLPFTPVTPVTGSDGLNRATIPIGSTPGFLRLQSTIAP